MSYDIILFETNRGGKPVEEFIESLSPNNRAKTIYTIRLLRQFGPFLKMPHSKKITRNLYELRVRVKEEIRVFYAYIGETICLLHAFKKKSQKIPSREIKNAEERLSTIDKI